MADHMHMELRININQRGALVYQLSGQMHRWNKQPRLSSHFNNLFPSYFNSRHFACQTSEFPLKHKLLAVIGAECCTNMQRNLPISGGEEKSLHA